MPETNEFDRARELTRNMAYALRCFQLWGVLRGTSHQLGLQMDENVSADKAARKFVADLYAYADKMCKLCSDWIDANRPDLDAIMVGINEGSEERE